MRPWRAPALILAAALACIASLALTTLPGTPLAAAPAAQAGSLKGVIGLGFGGGRVDGYSASLGGQVGTPGTASDILSFELTKTTGGLKQNHAWRVRLVAGEITINRSKASIVVNHPLGIGGVDGEFNFTFSGRPRLKSSCGVKHNMVYGTLKGMIRFKVGDHFFKTITVTRMTGWAKDNATKYTKLCLAPCTHYYSVQGLGRFSTTNPQVELNAQTQSGKQRSGVAATVSYVTAGSPFLQVTHVLYATRAKPLVRSNPKLSSARVSTPGGALSGSLSFKSSGRLRKLSPLACKGGYNKETARSAKVTKGRITAMFDSIGTFTFDTNLNAPLPGGVPALTDISRVF